MAGVLNPKNLVRWLIKGGVALFLIAIINMVVLVPLGMTGILNLQIGSIGFGFVAVIVGLMVVGYAVEFVNKVIK